MQNDKNKQQKIWINWNEYINWGEQKKKSRSLKMIEKRRELYFPFFINRFILIYNLSKQTLKQMAREMQSRIFHFIDMGYRILIRLT